MKKDQSFDSKIGEIEEIISKMQSGEMNVDEAVKEYKRAKKSLDDLKKHLNEAETKVSIVEQD